MKVARVGRGLTVAFFVFAALLQAQKPADPCKSADQSLAQGLYETAKTQYEACLKQGPVHFEALSNLGIVYVQLGQMDQAIRTYNQALALDPGNPQVRMNLGLAYLKTNRFLEAAPEFERSLMANLDDPKAEELLAFCHYQLKQYELAAVEAARAYRAKPDEPSAAFILGSSYLRLGLYKEAIPLLYTSLQKANSAEGHAVLGEAFLGVKAYRQALAEFQKAFALAPQTSGIHAELGTAYAGTGDTDKAVAEFEEELKQDANSFEANYYLGRLKRLGGDDENAKKYLTKADQLRPDDPSVAYEYAVYAMKDKDYARAEKLLEDTLNKVPSYTDAHVLLAEVYFKTHHREEGARETAIVNSLKKAEQEREDAEGKLHTAQGSDSKSGPGRR